MANIVTLGAYALITTDDIKDFTNSSSQSDVQRQRREINVMTELIERYCARKFKARKFWHEVHTGKDVRVDNFPIQNIDSVYNGFEVKTASGTADSGDMTTLVDSALTEADDFWNGAQCSVKISGTYQRRTVTDFVASTDTLTLDPALDGTSSGADFKLYLRDTTGYYLSLDSDYKDIDHQSGQIEFFGCGRKVVTYTGGFEDVPDDLKQATINLVVEALKPGFSAERAFGDANSTRELPSRLLRDAMFIVRSYRKSRV